MTHALRTRTFRYRGLWLSAVLLACLVVVMLAYPVVVRVLPTQVYTPAQQAYLEYNKSRTLSQVAPTWNAVLPEGDIVPTLFPGQHSRVRATLHARYEEHEGVSVTVYDLVFRGEYTLSHLDPTTIRIQLFFPFPSNLHCYDPSLLLGLAELAETVHAFGSAVFAQMSIGFGRQGHSHIGERPPAPSVVPMAIPPENLPQVNLDTTVESNRRFGIAQGNHPFHLVHISKHIYYLYRFSSHHQDVHVPDRFLSATERSGNLDVIHIGCKEVYDFLGLWLYVA